MNSALSPREIQARLRAGASIPEVAAEAGVDVDRISGFAIPVMAERAHITRTALTSTVRRRGDGSGHRRLGELIEERLRVRGLDSDIVEWDSWRQNDLKWRLVGLLDDQAASRAAEFVFDPKGRFSVADNPDARWMIGEELPGSQGDPDNENTIDFHDELALVRATSDDPAFVTAGTGTPGDEVPPFDSAYGDSVHTSELDELYDMLSGVSEDSVRIYLGLEDDAENDATGSGEHRDARDGAADDGAPERQASGPGSDGETAGDQPDELGVSEECSESRLPAEPDTDESVAEDLSEHPDIEATADPVLDPSVEESSASPAGGAEASGTRPAPDAQEASPQRDPSPEAPEQDPLVPEDPPAAPKRKPSRKRASIPSWDEIMFGGPAPR